MLHRSACGPELEPRCSRRSLLEDADDRLVAAVGAVPALTDFEQRGQVFEIDHVDLPRRGISGCVGTVELVRRVELVRVPRRERTEVHVSDPTPRRARLWRDRPRASMPTIPAVRAFGESRPSSLRARPLVPHADDGTPGWWST